MRAAARLVRRSAAEALYAVLVSIGAFVLVGVAVAANIALALLILVCFILLWPALLARALGLRGFDLGLTSGLGQFVWLMILAAMADAL